jgi:hypothetical protein
LPAHQYWQCADVILMCMRHQDSVERPVTDRFKIRKRIVSFVFGVHAAIQNQPMTVNLEIVAVRTDFDAPGQIREFQFPFFIIVFLFLL